MAVNQTCPYRYGCRTLEDKANCKGCSYAKVTFIVKTDENKEEDKNEESDMS